MKYTSNHIPMYLSYKKAVDIVKTYVLTSLRRKAFLFVPFAYVLEVEAEWTRSLNFVRVLSPDVPVIHV
jgi:hypothetical protein